jgi:hypothetical protein
MLGPAGRDVRAGGIETLMEGFQLESRPAPARQHALIQYPGFRFAQNGYLLPRRSDLIDLQEIESVFYRATE